MTQRDPLTDDTLPFGDDAHLAAIAARETVARALDTLARALGTEHEMRVLNARAAIAEAARLARSAEAAGLAAIRAEEELRDFEAEFDLVPRAL